MPHIHNIILLSFVLCLGLQVSGNPIVEMLNGTRVIIRPHVGIITVSNGQVWGTWGPQRMCRPGTYATGFSLKVEPDQGAGDNTALNAIALRCTVPGFQSVGYYTVQSSSGSWGRWSPNQWCTTGIIVAYQLRVQSYQGLAGDDSAVTNIRFKCSNGDVLEGNGLPWGTWGSYSSVCAGKGVCGIITKVEGRRGSLDDTALNDAYFFCCS